MSRYLPEELLAKMRSAHEGHAMEGERRTVTMLFADVQGSTSSAEQLDPEDWADIMNGAFSRLIAPIYRYEGTLAQLRGDAVLAFFGAPIAHEDDPVRALRAGLEIVEATASYSKEVEERWGLPAHVRVGINTGLVVVGAMGSDLRVEYTALGDAINVAARMEQTADPDTVRVSGHTLSLTHGAFEVEDLGPIEAKGKADPIPAFRVLRYTGSGTAGDLTPLVGRLAETAQLDELRERVVGGSGRIASIVAEAGVGKTRVLDEFQMRSRREIVVARHFDEPGELNWLRASSRSYDSGHHYSIIADMLTGWWFAPGSERTFDRVEAAVAAEGLDDPDITAFLAFIGGLQVPDHVDRFLQSLETPVLNAKSNQAALTYLGAVVKRRPTVAILEDLHWSDTLSLALVENLMSLAETGPLGLVVAMRPYRDEPSWMIHEVAARDHPHRYTSLTLEPLASQDSAGLLDELLGDVDVDPRARQGILDRSQGNPLYIEQMARALQDLDADDFDASRVPSSLSGLLTARLDRLSEEQRYLVQLASVLGSEFDRATLTALVNSSEVNRQVADLLRVGILMEQPDRPEVIGFRHALIQEAAYETILRRTRRELHRRVADQFIAGSGDPGEIARHLMAADEPEEAYPYLVSAGVAATRAMSLADAIELLQTATENTPDDADPELIVLAHDTLGDAFAMIPDLSGAAASYQRLYDYGERTQQPQAQVAALNRLGYATASLGADLGRATEYLAEARRIAEENNDDMGLAEYHMNSCFVASMAGDPGTAAAHDEETVRLGDRHGVDSVRLMGMVRRATNYIALLDWEHGLPAIESALEEANVSGHPEAIATVQMTGSASAKLARGDIREALEETTETLGTLDRYGSFFLALGHHQAASCHYELGDLEEALGHSLDVTRIAAAMGQPFTRATGLSSMALVYATVGLKGEIPDLRSEALDLISGPIGEFMASTVLADLGWVSSILEEHDAAIEQFTEGLGTSSTTRFLERPRLLIGRALAHLENGDSRSAEIDLASAREFVDDKQLDLYLAHLGLAEGRLAIRNDELELAERHLTGAKEAALSRGQRLHLIDIQVGLGRVAESLGDSDAIVSHSDSARSAVSSIAEGIADETLRVSFTAREEALLTAPRP
ncbi:MAG: adenylate/guanylate cyclase domain-containing protein [Acidimicrobiia bacterium]